MRSSYADARAVRPSSQASKSSPRRNTQRRARTYGWASGAAGNPASVRAQAPMSVARRVGIASHEGAARRLHQKAMVDQNAENLAAGSRVERPELLRLLLGETKARHFFELAAHPAYKSHDVRRFHAM